VSSWGIVLTGVSHQFAESCFWSYDSSETGVGAEWYEFYKENDANRYEASQTTGKSVYTLSFHFFIPYWEERGLSVWRRRRWPDGLDPPWQTPGREARRWTLLGSTRDARVHFLHVQDHW
jgi:hypothetical protein